jgi:hypothetical protein
MIAIGILLIVLGLVGLTPAGARLSMRMNEAPGSGGQGYKPKTVTGTRVLSIFVLIAGIAWTATSL